MEKSRENETTPVMSEVNKRRFSTTLDLSRIEHVYSSVVL